jgi:hypothetical protein
MVVKNQNMFTNMIAACDSSLTYLRSTQCFCFPSYVSYVAAAVNDGTSPKHSPVKAINSWNKNKPI